MTKQTFSKAIQYFRKLALWILWARMFHTEETAHTTTLMHKQAWYVDQEVHSDSTMRSGKKRMGLHSQSFTLQQRKLLGVLCTGVTQVDTSRPWMSLRIKVRDFSTSHGFEGKEIAGNISH